MYVSVCVCEKVRVLGRRTLESHMCVTQSVSLRNYTHIHTLSLIHAHTVAGCSPIKKPVSV